jgi:hypothetical protein
LLSSQDRRTKAAHTAHRRRRRVSVRDPGAGANTGVRGELPRPLEKMRLSAPNMLSLGVRGPHGACVHRHFPPVFGTHPFTPGRGGCLRAVPVPGAVKREANAFPEAVGYSVKAARQTRLGFDDSRMAREVRSEDQVEGDRRAAPRGIREASVRGSLAGRKAEPFALTHATRRQF